MLDQLDQLGQQGGVRPHLASDLDGERPRLSFQDCPPLCRTDLHTRLQQLGAVGPEPLRAQEFDALRRHDAVTERTARRRDA